MKAVAKAYNQANLYANIVDAFNAPIHFAFAYGSAVFPQQHTSKPHPTLMLDLILGVDSDLKAWHAVNAMQFPTHYASLMKCIGPAAISRLNHASAGVYFNPYTKFNLPHPSDVFVKYGVVHCARLCSDLLSWDSLYLAGRMHKPIKIIRSDPRIADFQTVNRANALRLSLLLILAANRAPRDFFVLTPHDLYTKIAGLSYHGDFRMQSKFLENRHKVSNLVTHQEPDFDSIYRPLMSSAIPGVTADHRGCWHVSTHVDFMVHLLVNLPTQFVLLAVAELYTKTPSLRSTAELDHAQACYKLATSAFLRHCLETALYKTIAWPAITQSLKGIFSAGITRTLKYAGSKLLKGYAASRS